MTRAKRLAMVGILVSIVFAGLIIFLWTEGLSRADEWANVLALFVALGVPVGSLIAWSLRRKGSTSQSAKRPEPYANVTGSFRTNIENANMVIDGEHNEIHGDINFYKEHDTRRRFPWR